MTDAHTTKAGDALCRLKANLPHQFLPDLFEVIKEYDFDIDRHMKTLHKKDDRLRTADKEIDRLRAENARLQSWHDAVMKRGSVGYWHQDLKEGFTKHDLLGAQPLIIRPQPLAKEQAP